MVTMVDNAKQNQSGQIDETACLHHQDPYLCLVGTIALSIFSQFHIQGQEKPNFVPDWSDTSKQQGYGEFGRRDWYVMKAFSGKVEDTAMSYDSELFLYLFNRALLDKFCRSLVSNQTHLQGKQYCKLEAHTCGLYICSNDCSPESCHR